MAASSAMRAATLKRGELAEFFEARIDLRSLERAEALHAETLTAETPHDGAVNHGTAQLAAADMVGLQIEALLREVADEAAREAIARAGRIEHSFQQVAGHDEEGIVAKQH